MLPNLLEISFIIVSRYWGAPCLGADWILAVARICPYLLIFFMDTALFYQVRGNIPFERPKMCQVSSV
jgi:hypothetical protein